MKKTAVMLLAGFMAGFAGYAAADGEASYTAGGCVGCHSGNIPGVPQLGDKAAWADRIAKGEEALVQSAINGVDGTMMSARGGSSLDDAAMAEAVKYMIEKSQ